MDNTFRTENSEPVIPEPVFLEHDGPWPIAFRPGALDGGGIPVIMLHGLESHSGWFYQSLDHIASLGHPVYAMDRSGSGASSAPRGVCRDYKDLLADINTLAQEVLSVHNCSRLHLLGHCFGAIPATAFACYRPSMLASLMLATPAIYTTAEPSLSDKIKILWSVMSGLEQRIPVPLEAAWFTDQEIFLQFIRTDALALRDTSARFYWEVMRARKFIHANEKKLTMPIIVATAGKDHICDNEKNKQFFDRLPTQKIERVLYPDAIHILEYSNARNAFFNDLTQWLSGLESDQTMQGM